MTQLQTQPHWIAAFLILVKYSNATHNLCELVMREGIMIIDNAE